MATFVICGRKFTITREELERRINFEPGPMTKKSGHVVEIKGKEYPIKPLLVELTGLPVERVVPLDAYKVLTDLGYRIKYCR